MADTPLGISIVATVRNEKETIAAFVDSLLKQSHQPNEIIIVDGASTDGTLEILQEYATRGEITLISQDCNIAQGRNLGIATVKTTHIGVTDAGCKVDADWLREIAGCFVNNPGTDVIAANFRFETHSRFEEAVIHATFRARRDRTDLSPYHPSSRSVAFTKDAWDRAGAYPEWLYAAEDTLFNIRLRQIGCKFVFCPKAFVQWRPRENCKALAKQRINFSRGNARTGFGVYGYTKSLRVHGLIALLLALGVWQPIGLLAALAVIAWYVRSNLWPQATANVPASDPFMRVRVLLMMEFVRLVQIYGFLRGQWDRRFDKKFIERQQQYMGIASVDELEFLQDGATTPQRGDSFQNLEAPLQQESSPKARRAARPADRQRNSVYLATLLAIPALGGVCAFFGSAHGSTLGLIALLLTAGTFSLLLAAKSVVDFTQTGPRLKDEVLRHYRLYAIFAFLRLVAYVFLVLGILSVPGILSCFSIARLAGFHPGILASAASGALSVLLLVALQFSRHLLWLPANITASYNYRLSRLYPYWRRLSPAGLRIATWLLLGLPAALISATVVMLMISGDFLSTTAFGSALLFFATLGMWLRNSEPLPKEIPGRTQRPNILLLGSDTLRADRVDGTYGRVVSPFLKSMAGRSTLFSQCYVPCARTAPSLLSLLTGCWPHRFGVRDNFVPDEGTRLPVDTLPHILKQHGYYTAALGDWCGADMGKFDLGFDYADVPEDQWNIKLFIRQGPKDLRLFLSLFTRNRFGKIFLPELYYLGGVPQTDEMGLEARHLISHLAEQNQPFFLNVFFSTTHGPFGSEYPYYTRFAQPDYRGESKFVMARVTDPWEIIRRQAEPREAFDLDQIINLYDGCVARFDDEVKRIMDHLDHCGLAENTIVVVYSDHGMEFFEHQTWGQGNSATSDVSNRIPLLIRVPGRDYGHTVTQPVRNIDLAPTLLELVGIGQVPEMDGVSLQRFLQDPNSKLELDVYGETGIWLTDLPGTPAGHLRYPDLLDLLTVRDVATGTISLKPEQESIIVRAKDRMIRRGRWKLVYQPLDDGHLLKLYDLERDPHCLTDVSTDNPSVVSNLWLRLQSWISAEAGVSIINSQMPMEADK